jgi:16S rRNA (guanine(1405)-N(7))-methyltransferase
MKIDETAVQAMVAKVLDTKKYRHTGLNPVTIEALIHYEAPYHTSKKQLLKTVKRKLHNIVAPYLGEPDYAALTEDLQQIQDCSLDSPQLIEFCRTALSAHASTAERIPVMSEFYSRLFTAAGIPNAILDLACGLHPLGFPWMGLPTTVRYHAYDILQPRVDFINQFFIKLGMAPLAENRDILIDPPTQPADLGIIFKEAHRFEKRQPGCNRVFWESLNVKYLAVSLPSQNLSGTLNLLDGHRSLVHANLPDNRRVSEILVDTEIIFLIERDLGGQND